MVLRPAVTEEFFVTPGGTVMFAITAPFDGSPFLDDLRNHIGHGLSDRRRQFHAALATVEELESRHGDMQDQRHRIVFVVYALVAEETFESERTGAVC